MPDLVAVLPLVGIALIFWLLIVRPASRRQAQLRSVQQSLEVGTQVLLAAGLYGIIRSVDGDKISLEVADGVVVTAARGAVVDVVDAEGSK
ncbi:preprotein translocase subunit YajC [Nocardioides sp.]|uniref:preprotein translocase subunit YajC n=1 Tax=Nocardioides sp. TaxID=35761 RepID=UPI003D129920